MTGQRHHPTAAQSRQVCPAFDTLRRCRSATLAFELPHCRPITLTAHYRRLTGSKMLVIVAEDHAAPPDPVFEVVMQAFLGAQSLEKLQVRLSILRAEIPGRVVAAQRQAPIFTGNAVLLEHLIEDLRHRTGTEDSLAEALGQTSQSWSQAHLAESGPRGMITLDEFMQLSMHMVSGWPEMQRGRAVQQTGKVKHRVIDQQFQFEHERLADGFSTGKGQDLKGVGQTCNIQTK
jgi:hypothetical protein